MSFIGPNKKLPERGLARNSSSDSFSDGDGNEPTFTPHTSLRDYNNNRAALQRTKREHDLHGSILSESDKELLRNSQTYTTYNHLRSNEMETSSSSDSSATNSSLIHNSSVPTLSESSSQLSLNLTNSSLSASKGIFTPRDSSVTPRDVTPRDSEKRTSSDNIPRETPKSPVSSRKNEKQTGGIWGKIGTKLHKATDETQRRNSLASPPLLRKEDVASMKGTYRGSMDTSMEDGSMQETNLIDELSYNTTNPKETKDIKARIHTILKSKNKSKREKLFQMVDKAGQSILHVAVQKARDLVPLLIEKKVDINQKDQYGETALEIVANIGDENGFLELLNNGAIVTQKAFINFTINFCSSYCPALLNRLLQEPGIGINTFVRSSSPLHGATINKRENLVEGLIGSTLMAELLLENGADPKLANERGDTALDWALYADNIKTARILMCYGAVSNKMGDMGKKAESEKNSVAHLLELVKDIRSALEGIHFEGTETLEYIMQRLIKCKIDEVGIENLNKENLQAMGIHNPNNVNAILNARKGMKNQIEGSEAFKKSRCDFYLVADYLAEPVQLWNNDVTIVGRKQLGELSESAETKEVVKDQLMFEVGGGIVAVNMGDTKIPSVIQHLTGKSIFTMEKGKTYQLEEGDIIYLSNGKEEGKPLFPLTVIASTNRTFNKTSVRDLEEWLPTVVDVPSDSVSKQEEGKAAGRRLNYRTLQYRLQKNEIAGSEENLLPENLLYTILSTQLFDNTESVKEIRAAVAKYLSEHGEESIEEHLPSLSSFVKTKSWEEYLSQINPENGKIGSIGDGLTLVAVAQVFHAEIWIITSEPRMDYIVKISPKGEISKKIVLGHLEHLNFVSLIQPVADNSTVSAWNTTDLIDEKELMIEDLLGKGSSGHVYSAMWNGFRVATKKILNIDRKKRDAFLKETLFLRKLRHPNIYLFMGTCIRDGDLYIVTEYMEKGSLKTMLAKEKKDLPWGLVVRMALDIAQGMNYLHSYKPIIIHRDLKTGNILVDKDHNLKICDFGVAKFMQKENKVTRNYFSTVAWSSPELLENGGYTEKADIYAYGLCLWSLLTGVEPWETKNEFQTIYAVLNSDERPVIPETNPKFAALIEQCWTRDPLERPAFGKIIEDLRKLKEESVSTSETLASWTSASNEKEENSLMREMKALQDQLDEEKRKNKELLVRSSPGTVMDSSTSSNPPRNPIPIKSLRIETDPLREITASLERSSKLSGLGAEELRSRMIEMWQHQKTLEELSKNGFGDPKNIEKLKTQTLNTINRLWAEMEPSKTPISAPSPILDAPKSPIFGKRSKTPELKSRTLSSSQDSAASASASGSASGSLLAPPDTRVKPPGLRRGSISTFMRSSPDLNKEARKSRDEFALSLEEALRMDPKDMAAQEESKRLKLLSPRRGSTGKESEAEKMAKRGSLPSEDTHRTTKRSIVSFFRKSEKPEPSGLLSEAERRKQLMPRPSRSETCVSLQHPSELEVELIQPMAPLVPLPSLALTFDASANKPIKKTLSKSSSDLPFLVREERRESPVHTEEISFRPITPSRGLTDSDSGSDKKEEPNLPIPNLTLSMGTSSSSSSSFPSFPDIARRMSEVSIPISPSDSVVADPFATEEKGEALTPNPSEEETKTDTTQEEEEPAQKVVAPVIAEEPVPVPQNSVQLPDGLNAVWAIDFAELQFNKETDEIGSGNSAVVYKGIFRGQRVAIKILQNEPDFAEFKKEIDILSLVRSPDVCYFYGACVAPSYCIIAEFMGRGSLFNVMENPNYKFTWKRVLRFATQAANSLNSLHNWKPTIVHRDIKSHNMLVDSNHVLKIADLGLSRFTTFDNQDTLFRARGSLAYMAPEVWTSSSSKVGLGFTTKSDVYSYAIVLWEMMWRCYFGKWRIPFPALFPFAIVTQVAKMNKRPDLDPGMPKPLIKLVQLCWDADPVKRPDCTQIVAILNEITKEYEENKEEWGVAPPRPLSESRQSSLRKMAV